ncbi:DUF5681 domain-containing protein [Sphingobium aromaticiconvertens]|uniref:DUF5681 domain-containing protein n=1 Tax=Sphingobium aromaticiconvertens TaxID=365341 RepID=UPI0030197D5E
MTDRDRSGRFGPGVSGNKRGRPKKEIVRRETMIDFDLAILDVANRLVPLDSSGSPDTMTLFDYNALALMTGKAANRLAAKASIEIVLGAAARCDNRRRHEMKEEHRAYINELRRKGELNQYLEEHGLER